MAGISGTSGASVHVNVEALKDFEQGWRKFFYYPKPDENKSITHLIDLHKKGGENRAKLIVELKKLCKNEKFMSNIGLARNKICKNCKPKEPCDTLKTDDLFHLLYESNGICRSCNISLSLYEENDAAERPKINGFQIFKYANKNCITKNDMKPADDGRMKINVMCKGCTSLAEICYNENVILNYYRKIIFHKSSYKTNGVDSVYFPRLDYVDEKYRNLDIISSKKMGGKLTILKNWLKQEGFVTYLLPKQVEIEMLKNEDHQWKYGQDGKNKLASDGKEIIEDMDDDDDRDQDQDLNKNKSENDDSDSDSEKLSVRKDNKSGNIIHDDDRDHDHNPEAICDKNGNYHNRHINQSSYFGFKDCVKDRELSKDSSKRKKPVIVRTVEENEMYKNRKGYVIFKIPIDPRKSVQKNGLASIELTRKNRNIPFPKKGDEVTAATVDNYLFTTYYLSALEKRFEYEDFIRWGLDVFRRITPPFKEVEHDADANSDSTSMVEKRELENKELEKLVHLSIKESEVKDKIKELKKEGSKYTAEKKEIESALKSKCIGMIEANDSETNQILQQHNIQATIRELKIPIKPPTKEYLTSNLFNYFKQYKLNRIKDDEILKVRLAQIVADIYSPFERNLKEAKFELKYVDPVKAAEKETKRQITRDNSKKRKIEEEKKKKNIKSKVENKSKKLKENSSVETNLANANADVTLPPPSITVNTTLASSSSSSSVPTKSATSVNIGSSILQPPTPTNANAKKDSGPVKRSLAAQEIFAF